MKAHLAAEGAAVPAWETIPMLYSSRGCEQKETLIDMMIYFCFWVKPLNLCGAYKVAWMALTQPDNLDILKLIQS
jgi:hypothetical protein